MILAALLLGCGRPRAEVVLAPPAPTPGAPAGYAPVQFPRDEAPHDMLTEWWYYTGHLQAIDGRRYGFEYVIFQTVRGDYPVFYLGQLAITDRSRGTFQHVSRVGQGSQIGPRDRLTLRLQDWTMQAALGRDRLEASMDERYAIRLDLESLKPPVLHDEDGLVSFGPAGDSYYYSYTRMAVRGTLADHGTPLEVEGQAWFDHQWGNFLVLGGGWDWFSVQLDDGAELMLNYLRDDADRVVGVWGTYVDPAGKHRSLAAGDFSIDSTGRWTSPNSGGTYPMGWRVTLRQPFYDLRITPVLPDQELIPPEGGGAPIYWEGAADVEGTRDGQLVRGLAYVELTGYAR